MKLFCCVNIMVLLFLYLLVVQKALLDHVERWLGKGNQKNQPVTHPNRMFLFRHT